MQLQYLNASEDDFDTLVELRIEAMRESLEEVGRFNRMRSIERFRSSFVADDTTKIFYEDNLAGFYAVTRAADHLHLSHLYVKPEYQSLGIGTLVMETIIELSNEVGLPIRLGALKKSRSNAFYLNHGFAVTAEDEWDTHYERQTKSKQDGAGNQLDAQ